MSVCVSDTHFPTQLCFLRSGKKLCWGRKGLRQNDYNSWSRRKGRGGGDILKTCRNAADVAQFPCSVILIVALPMLLVYNFPSPRSTGTGSEGMEEALHIKQPSLVSSNPGAEFNCGILRLS